MRAMRSADSLNLQFPDTLLYIAVGDTDSTYIFASRLMYLPVNTMYTLIDSKYIRDAQTLIDVLDETGEYISVRVAELMAGNNRSHNTTTEAAMTHICYHIRFMM